MHLKRYLETGKLMFDKKPQFQHRFEIFNENLFIVGQKPAEMNCT